MGKRLSRPAHVEIYRGRDGWWRFRLVYANHEKGTASQAYHGSTNSQSKWGAKRGARSAHPGLEIVEA